VVTGSLIARRSSMFIRSRIASLTFSVRPSRTEVAPTMFCQKLVGVADLNPAALEWFDDGQTFLAMDYRKLLVDDGTLPKRDIVRMKRPGD
jgi:hypothetical protein